MSRVERDGGDKAEARRGITAERDEYNCECVRHRRAGKTAIAMS